MIKRPRALLTFALLWALALFSPLVVSSPAHADEGGGEALGPRQKKQARKLVKQAAEHKRMGDRQARRKRAKQARASYRKAALAYREAYRITAAPGLLIELGAVYRARGERRWAVRVYKKYLALEPAGAEADAATAAIAELESELAEAESADSAGEESSADDAALDPTDIIGPEPAPEPEPEPEPENESAPVPEPAPIKRGERAGKRQHERPGALFKWSGVGAGATGVALLGLGVFFGLDARSKAATLSANDDAWTPEDRALIDSGRSSQTKMYIFTSVGAVLVAGGAALFYRGLVQDRRADERARQRSAVIAPRLTPESATLTITGWF